MSASEQELKRQKLEHEVWKLGVERKRVENHPVAKGEFMFIGAVFEEPVHEMIEQMDIWSRNHPGDPITLVINSQGGVVVDGFALYDFIMELKRRGHSITTKGLGLQASMGGILLQAGDERVMTPRSWMLVHEVQGIAEGSFSDMKNVMKFNERLQNQALDILAERSNWSRRTIKTKWKDDLWLSAQDALKAGFIDRIEEDK